MKEAVRSCVLCCSTCHIAFERGDKELPRLASRSLVVLAGKISDFCWENEVTRAFARKMKLAHQEWVLTFCVNVPGDVH